MSRRRIVEEATVGSVRVAVVGVGNCASALVQGVHYYKGVPDDGFIPGLMRPRLGVPVQRGMTHDGLGHYLSQIITKAPGSTADIKSILRETRTDVVVNFLPVGSEMATKWYVEQVLDAGCGFVNCIPVFIARENYWRRRFEDRGLPIVGDDVKSQVGATIIHRILTKLFMDRGVRLERTSQLNGV